MEQTRGTKRSKSRFALGKRGLLKGRRRLSVLSAGGGLFVPGPGVEEKERIYTSRL